MCNKPMRKLIVLSVITLSVGAYIASESSVYKSVNTLVLKNVEALATGEENGNYICWGTGDIDCNGL